ncbi:precorrin-2 C20-methyltransferase [Prochlorothrix hollandica PCC 9006 = CALU 1027]|uniref:Precorrin-2 C20-methyltransferase n=1 Tax=Prochlorothrix hollandica PCC 9006 = CALU 1027 TaxID=317619 RepID=A0A0M2PY95_PROHO|nr:precorrin-2 C20-methyltransferase [Prochlorothrix hollandica PCC 9006 = CALU 1027]
MPPDPATGTLYGISAGPGDPDLITVKGLRLLQHSPVVAFPAGRGDRPGIAETIIQPWLQPHQQRLPLYFPYVQDPQVLAEAWHTAAQQVNSHLHQGQDVAFVAEGDVSFYSTFSYLAAAVQQTRPQGKIVTVPGVCSPLAAAAVQGQPLTLWQQKLVVLPTCHQMQALEDSLDFADVVVLMKVSSRYGQVWSILERRNLLHQSYIVERCGAPNQQVYQDLRGLPHLALSYFSVLVVSVQRDHPPLATLRSVTQALGALDDRVPPMETTAP